MSARQAMEFRCPEHGAELRFNANALECVAQGCRFPIVDDVPRFVEPFNYASAFGWQWNRFGSTQLDSYTGTTISRDRLTRCCGGNLAWLSGKTLLEAGCGAGRFTEILLAAGARVYACDLSNAIDSNRRNNGRHAHAVFAQANITALPFAPGSFDIVVCLGVVQHTPDPEATLAKLAAMAKPGGTLIVDCYSDRYPMPFQRRVLRDMILSFPRVFTSERVVGMLRFLARIHRFFRRPGRYSARFYAIIERFSPLVDYTYAYPDLSPDLLDEWAILDTHDTLTDVYKHLRSKEQFATSLTALGLDVVRCEEGGNGIEAIARHPF